MFRPRPPLFFLICSALCVLQLTLFPSLFPWVKSSATSTGVWQFAALGGIVAILGMIFPQSRGALKRMLRRDKRLNPEVAAERCRIARDLHDHIGAQLVFALATLNSANGREPDLRPALENCLLHLRLLVDSMEGAQGPLLDRFAQLRYRLEPALRQRGIRLSWDLQSLAFNNDAHLEGSAELIAIVQEAVSNALQHANATEVTVSVRDVEHPRGVCLEVCDNGRGVTLTAPSRRGGSGLAGMASRARLAGGTLQVLKSHEGGGTCIRVVIPRRLTLASGCSHR